MYKHFPPDPLSPQKVPSSGLAKISSGMDMDLPGYIGGDNSLQSTNEKMLAYSQKSHASPGARPPSLQQVLAEAGTVAGTTAQVSQAVFLEVSKALSQAAHQWTQEDHNVESPVQSFNSPMRAGGFGPQSGGFRPQMQQGMMGNQFGNPMNRGMPNQRPQNGMQSSGLPGNQFQQAQSPHHQQQSPPGMNQQQQAPPGNQFHQAQSPHHQQQSPQGMNQQQQSPPGMNQQHGGQGNFQDAGRGNMNRSQTNPAQQAGPPGANRASAKSAGGGKQTVV